MADEVPTAEEARRAEETLARFRSAQLAETADRKRLVQAAFDGGYAGLADRLADLPADVRLDGNVMHHLDAIIRGLSGIATPPAS